MKQETKIVRILDNSFTLFMTYVSMSTVFTVMFFIVRGGF